MIKRASAALVCCLGLAGSMSGQSADKFAPVRGAMQQMVETIGSPSVAVAVAKDGRIVWEHAMGWANQAERIPARR